MDFKDLRRFIGCCNIYFFTQVNSIPLIEGIELEYERVGTVADENSAYSDVIVMHMPKY